MNSSAVPVAVEFSEPQIDLNAVPAPVENSASEMESSSACVVVEPIQNSAVPVTMNPPVPEMPMNLVYLCLNLVDLLALL